MASLDLGYARPKATRHRAIYAGSLEDHGAPQYPIVDTLEPIDAPTPERGEAVAVAPIGRLVRDTVNAGRLTWSTIALTLGWTYGPDGGADTTRVLRRLGLIRGSVGHGLPAKQSLYLNRELAASIVRAAHLDPVDVGL